jgi:tetratricopeptide (TPR) repeat protein
MIGGMKASQGDAKPAIGMLERALAIVEKHKDADDYQSALAAIYLFLVISYKALHDSTNARAFLAKSLEIEELLSGLESQRVLSTIRHLAELNKGEAQRQTSTPSGAAEGRVEQQCREALALFQGGKYEEAKGAAKNAVELSKATFGVISTNFAYSLQILAGTYKGLGDITNTLILCLSAIPLWRSTSASLVPSILTWRQACSRSQPWKMTLGITIWR